MTVVNPKSISGINSITMASGSDNLLTIHTTNTTERVRVSSDGDVIVGSGITVSPDGDIFATGVTTSTTFVGALTGNVTGNISGGTVAGSTGTFTGDVDIADKIIHTGDTNTALRFPAADTITAETGGSERFRIYSNGAVLIGADSGEAGGDAKLAIDCSGLDINDGVGDASNYGLIFANDSTTDKANGIGFFNDSASTCGGYIVHQDKGAANIGDLVFGTSASSDTPVERVRITSDGKLGINISTPGTLEHQHESSSGANYHKFTNSTTGSAGTDGAYIGLDANEQFIMWTQETGKLRFAVADSERVYINNDGHLGINDGNLVIGTSGHGIDFSATSDSGGSMSNELLDDYEEGTFTPSLLNVSTPNYEAIGGTYTKVGRIVHGTITIGVASGLDTSDGSGFNIGGLPFTGTGESCVITFGRYTNLLGSKAGEFRNVRFTQTSMILQEGSNSSIAYNECSSSGYLLLSYTYHTS